MSYSGSAQTKLDNLLPVRGFCIDAARPSGLDSFIHFIDSDLGPGKVYVQKSSISGSGSNWTLHRSLYRKICGIFFG
jgi:hypothetical protein